jgi:hypothetical protein
MDKSTRKLTRKRCPVGQRFSKKLNKCVPSKKEESSSQPIPIEEKPLFPTTVFGNVMDIPILQKTNLKKRCPKGSRYNKKTDDCDPISEKIKNHNASRSNNGAQKKGKQTRKIYPSETPLELEKENIEELREQPLITNEQLFEENLRENESIGSSESELESEQSVPLDESVPSEEQESLEYNFLYPELDDPEFSYKIAIQFLINNMIFILSFCFIYEII